MGGELRDRTYVCREFIREDGPGTMGNAGEPCCLDTIALYIDIISVDIVINPVNNVHHSFQWHWH
jgi:hypothetical protein